MADETQSPAVPVVDFDTHPDRYRHWRLDVDGDVATVTLTVDEKGGLVEGYELKANSYDLGVDIELYDAVQRLRFEHPEVKAVVMTGGVEKMFCAGANIRMLAQSSHAWKVNFCKFTNETRNTIEEARETSGQTWIAALNGTAAGGGYELALACDEIVLIDDGTSTVSLPEVPLLGVLPGTGGLTRVVDKRHVRKDRADLFATKSEGYRGATAVEWGLVDGTVPRNSWDEEIGRRAREAADASSRPGGDGVELTPLAREEDGDTISYPHVTATIDRDARRVDLTVAGPEDEPPADPHAQGVDYYPLAVARALDDLVLRLRTNEQDLGAWVLRTTGDLDAVLAYDAQLGELADDWFVHETTQYLKRTFKRLDVTSRSLVAVIEPGSCFARVPAGAGAGLRPAVHARRRLRGRRPRRRPGGAGDDRQQRRPVPDGQRALPAAVAVLGPRRRPRPGPQAARRAARRAGRGRGRAGHDGARRHRLRGRDPDRARGAGLALARRADRAWRPTTGSSARRRWRPRSSAGSRPGRTGSSTGPTPPVPTARCGATAAGSGAATTTSGCERDGLDTGIDHPGCRLDHRVQRGGVPRLAPGGRRAR